MVRAGIGTVALVAVFAIACGDGEVRPPDASTGDGGSNGIDASDDVSALELEWKTDPGLDESPTGPLDLVVTFAKFTIEDLRVVGDAAVLTRGSFELDFGRDDNPRLRFSPAAPGLYANFIGRIAKYDIRGTIRVGGDTEEFRIHDEPPQEPRFDIPLQNAEVFAGETTVVKLEIEIGDVVEEIDWSLVEPKEGVLEIDNNSDLIGDVREELAEAFQLD